MITIAETISRVRKGVKAVKEDAFLTDRYLYSVILKYGKLLVKRQDNESKIMRYLSLFEVLPCVDLIEVDKVEACCAGIKSKCIIMRTKDELPNLMEGSFGPLIRDVTSIDGSTTIYQTFPGIYTNIANSTNYKYNRTKYYWYIDGHMYFPNMQWDAVKIEAIWEDDIAYLKCNESEEERCLIRQDHPTHIPDYLFAEIEQFVFRDLGLMIQVPSDNKDDSQHPIR